MLASRKYLNSLAVVAISTSLAFVAYKFFFDKDEKLLVGNGEKVIVLLEGERDGMVHAPSINTVTFYEGKIDSKYLQKRVEEIVHLNPWLDSRLVTLKKRGGLCAVFDPSRPERFAHFEVVKIPGISESSPYTDVMTQVDPLLVKMGRQAADKEEPVFTVRLVEITENKKYALVVSLSHVIGDGHTYYNIYNMLNPTTKVSALEYERNQDFMGELDKIQGPHISNWLRKPTTIIGFIANAVARKAPFIGAFEVNSAPIERLKSEAMKDPTTTSAKFVSTNDVLTALFHRVIGAEFGMMCLNYRNRMRNFKDSLSGNYEGILVYELDEAASAVALRESIERGHPRSLATPSVYQSLQSNIPVVTNWSTFYEDIVFPEAKQIIHLPVLKAADVIFRDTMIIFRTSSKSKLGVLYAGRKFDAASFRAAFGDVLGKQCLPDSSNGGK